MKANFKHRIAAGEALLGHILTLGSPEIAEMAASAGFDWLWIDLEHTPTSLQQAQRMLQSIAGRVSAVVRVPWNDPVWIKRALDLGFDGIVIPQIRSATEATAAVQACLYPPAGIRSIGVGRAQGYGMDLQPYLQRANVEIAIILQIEHHDAVDHIEEILEVAGSDAILVGPYDLSASYGRTGQIGHETVISALSRINQAALARKKPRGIFAADAATARRYLSSGFGLVVVGTDAMSFWSGAKQFLRDLRERSVQP